MEKLDLEAIRRRIDKIDAQLVAALEERMEAVLEVAAYKKQQGLPVLDAAREAQVLSKACMRLQHKEYAPAVTAMMRPSWSRARLWSMYCWQSREFCRRRRSWRLAVLECRGLTVIRLWRDILQDSI